MILTKRQSHISPNIYKKRKHCPSKKCTIHSEEYLLKKKILSGKGIESPLLKNSF